MDNYEGNSHKSKETPNSEEKQADKRAVAVASGTVKPATPSTFQKIAGIIFQTDPSTVKTHIINDILIPAGKKLITDVIDGLVYPNGKPGGGSGSRTYYAGCYSGSTSGAPTQTDSQKTVKSVGVYDYENIAFKDRGDAELVLDQLFELSQKYPKVRVFDLYEAANITPPYTSSNYGWRNLQGSEVIRGYDGSYYLRLPKAQPLD